MRPGSPALLPPALGIDRKACRSRLTCYRGSAGELRRVPRLHARPFAGRSRHAAGRQRACCSDGEADGTAHHALRRGRGGIELTKGFSISPTRARARVYTHHHTHHREILHGGAHPREDLGFQFPLRSRRARERVGHASANSLFHPDDPANSEGPTATRPRVGVNAFPVPAALHAGRRGFSSPHVSVRRRAGAARLTGFVSDQQSWTRQESWRYHEVGADGELIRISPTCRTPSGASDGALDARDAETLLWHHGAIHAPRHRAGWQGLPARQRV